MKRGWLFKRSIILLTVVLMLQAGCTAGNSRVNLTDGKKPPAARSEMDLKPGMYRVVRTVDGDTVVIRFNGKNEKVRFIGINTPEVNHPEKGLEPYGSEAAEYTKNLLENQSIRVKFDIQQRDRYGRLLGYIYLEDGTFVNARLLSEGYAQVLTIPPNVKYAEYFVRLEREARKGEKGLWGIFYYNMDGYLETE